MVSTIDHLEVVAIASNGQQAIEMTREHQPDILLMDINMPLVDGLTAIRQIKFSRQTLAVSLSRLKEIRTHSAKPCPLACGSISSSRSLWMNWKRRSSGFINEWMNPFKSTRRPINCEERMKNIWKQLGNEYIKSKRTDDQAVAVFEQLVDTPNCEQRWI